MGQDLRSYLDLVKRRKPDELLIVSREMDPAYELTAAVVKLEREARQRPVVRLRERRGTRFPVLTNLHASRSRLALAMSCAPEDMLRTYLRAMERPVPPRIVPTGPVKEVVLRGDRRRPPRPAPDHPPRGRRRRVSDRGDLLREGPVAARRGTAPTTG